MEPIPRTPERLARGKYLVEGLVQCTLCHSEYDFTQRPSHPVEGKKGGGQVFPNEEVELPDPNRVVAPNITPDPDSGRENGRMQTLCGRCGKGLVMTAARCIR